MKRKTINKHFTLETRYYIEHALNDRLTVTEIAKNLARDRSNVGREITRYNIYSFPSSFNNYHYCLEASNCPYAKFECEKYCDKVKFDLCDNLKDSPHVCNGCQRKNLCRKVKIYYKALEANNKYLERLSTSRSKLHYSEYELEILNVDFYNLVMKNRSVYHSLTILNKRGFNFKQSSIYRQIKEGKLKLKSSDLPRVRQLKKDKEEKDKSYKRDIAGHTYEDYEEYRNNHPNANEMQMDTVSGIQGKEEPVILTFQIVKIKFLFMFLITQSTMEKVLEIFDKLKEEFTYELFEKLFEILLTDNGHEFYDYNLFQAKCVKMNIFYCHPYSSYEKGEIENNHELIRRVIPKYISLKPYTQKDLNVLCCHINSLYRKELDGKCPFDLVEDYIPLKTLEKMDIKKIKDEDVNLNPSLLGEKNINNIKKYLTADMIKKAKIKL